jgi:hypothetical protein
VIGRQHLPLGKRGQTSEVRDQISQFPNFSFCLDEPTLAGRFHGQAVLQRGVLACLPAVLSAVVITKGEAHRAKEGTPAEMDRHRKCNSEFRVTPSLQLHGRKAQQPSNVKCEAVALAAFYLVLFQGGNDHLCILGISDFPAIIGVPAWPMPGLKN